MPRALAAALAVLGATAVTAVASGGVSASARGPASTAGTCSFKGLEQEHMGPSYVTSLSVSGVGCSTGKAVVRAYYRCRVRSGGVRGYCRRSVLGFRCSEKRSGIKVQFDARVTCVSGSRRVFHTYTQNT